MTYHLFEHLPIFLLMIGVVFAIGMALGRLSSFIGVPTGLFFLVVGMLLGEDGPGQIKFNDYELTYAIGNVALGLILFYGGLSTPIDSLKKAFKPAIVLATVGVIGVSFVTAVGFSFVHTGSFLIAL